MTSRIEGERLIIVGTVNDVVTGQEFDYLPPHMTLAIWHTLSDSRKDDMLGEMDTLFTNQYLYQNLVGGRHRLLGEQKNIPARMIHGAETEPSFSLIDLIDRIGAFRADDIYAHKFKAHITDMRARRDENGEIITPGFRVKEGRELALSKVALFAAYSDSPLHRVVGSFDLRSEQ